MPLNTLRLNHAPSSHPNDRIVFIKPLPRLPAQSVDYETADTLLRAIAAQCLPIMKSHYISVTTLEEHEPNPEFIGRNFNNGEIIQLVLRGKNGGWLPVNMIQMVMMHELAHNSHMNHGRDFWKTRNLYAEEMRALWAKGYTGEGFWGGGRTLDQLGDVMAGNVVRSEELKDLPVCGGTFRSRRKKRKAKAQSDGLTWKEKKERRIEKKFGKNGVALGEDEDKRLSLELAGKGPLGVKPRVAQSKRGRELRAAAALARFETNKKEINDLSATKADEDITQSEDEYEDSDAGQADARDRNGNRLQDSKGQSLIKVCGDEDGDDAYVKQEMTELEGLTSPLPTSNNSATKPFDGLFPNAKPATKIKSIYDIPQHKEESPPPESSTVPPTHNRTSTNSNKTRNTHAKPQPNTTTTAPSSTSTTAQPKTTTDTTTLFCPICSLANPPMSPTCQACAHVLDRRKDPRAWKCASETCGGSSEYVNAGDVGRCGICGARKP